MEHKQTKRPVTHKVRRDVAGGRRGQGNKVSRRAHRANPEKIHIGRPDNNLSSVAGLVAFGVFLRKAGIDQEMSDMFGRLKRGSGVVYPMAFQLRLGIDMLAAGETRLFGVEALACDPLFSRLAGGLVPSVDTLYDDFARFDTRALSDLDALAARQGLLPVPALRQPLIYADLDTTVTPTPGEHEGAVPGPNPKYHGRPSYHPMLMRLAATDTIVGAQLRRGDTGFGADDVATVVEWVGRIQRKARPRSAVCVRIDSAGDCTAFMKGVHDCRAYFLTKAKLTPDLFGAVAAQPRWRTTDADADGKPTRQVAEIDFRRRAWDDAGLGGVRVIAVRSQDRQGKQTFLADDLAWTVQVFFTNRMDEDADEIAWSYDSRAGIEALIAELKGAWGIGQTTGYAFVANHAMLLLKVLTHNLLRRYAREVFPQVARWRTPWLRRVLVRVPGRLSRSGRKTTLHLPSGSPVRLQE